MKRLLFTFAASLIVGSALALSYFTVRVDRKSDGLQLYIRSERTQPVEVGRLAARVARIPGTPVRIQIDETTRAADLLEVLHLLASNSVQAVSIFWPRDLDGDQVCDFAENSEVLLSIDKSMPNGCLEGEYWGYSGDQEKTKEPNKTGGR